MPFSEYQKFKPHKTDRITTDITGTKIIVLCHIRDIKRIQYQKIGIFPIFKQILQRLRLYDIIKKYRYIQKICINLNYEKYVFDFLTIYVKKLTPKLLLFG